MEIIAYTAKEKGIITISGDSSHVDSGALISVGISYFDLGVQAADMAKQILVDGTEISQIPVKSSSNFIKKENAETRPPLGLEKVKKRFGNAQFTE